MHFLSIPLYAKISYPCSLYCVSQILNTAQNVDWHVWMYDGKWKLAELDYKNCI